MPREWLHQIPDADDRHILASLAGAAVAYEHTGGAEGATPTAAHTRWQVVSMTSRFRSDIACPMPWRS